ncbi:XRE family transcriptional regulator [Helcococcus ovis]|uniref:helix-turn-helix transcriptional regulator n=1 Tax=Helcococcus ovis TaxID=72026 RepID=UPI00106FF020|nr:helix-turn-helix transcriptional regulator [Helcococcus ovis]TFF68336.1 XRE family transcriptional regulator [Helcococcus ovis]WNZ00912.1 helix-turn-helix transcriptional regulator [Helcococcus ovis]
MTKKYTLKALRVNKGLSTLEASKWLNVSEPTLISWEKGRTFPKVNKLPEIEKLYGISYDSINFLIDNTVKP